MYYTEEPQKKIAGMLSMHVDTMVPKLARSYQDVACQMNERKVCVYHRWARGGCVGVCTPP